MHPFHTVSIRPDERDRIDKLIVELTATYRSVEDDAFQRDASVAAHELPRTLRSALYEFKLDEPAAGCVVDGFEVDDAMLGPTPADWRTLPPDPPTRREEFFFFLCATLLGEPIAWATQQNGRVMHDIFPIPGYEDDLIGAGSHTPLPWHTEEAFHPLRGDYIGLMCLRNADGIATTYADFDRVPVGPEDEQVLREELFPIRPDPSHLERTDLPRQGDVPAELLDRSYRWNRDCDEDPSPVAVLFGGTDRPYLRIDPAFMPEPRTPRAARALRTLIAQIEANLTGFALRPGQILFIDNFRTVHGRDPFRPRYDGTDRWLKRLNIVRDLRKSRGNRIAAGHRVIY